MPDSLIEHHLLASVSDIEHEFNVCLTPTVYVDYKDYRAEDYDRWFFINTDHKPISPNADDVSIELQYIKDLTTIALPKAWYRIYPESGQIQLTPTSGTMGSFVLSQAGVMVPGLLNSRKDYPQLIKVTYKAGFEQDKIPYVFNQLIGMMTAVQVLSIMADLIMGQPGINSYGIGLDGMSQSVTKEGFAQRINTYNDKIASLKHELMQFYESFTFASL